MRVVSLPLLFLLCSRCVLADSPAQDALRQLKSVSPTQRIAALRKLAHLPPDASASDPLLNALQDPSRAVRIEALKTWGIVGDRFNSYMAQKYHHESGITPKEMRRADEAHKSWKKKLVQSIGRVAEQRDGW